MATTLTADCHQPQGQTGIIDWPTTLMRLKEQAMLAKQAANGDISPEKPQDVAQHDTMVEDLSLAGHKTPEKKTSMSPKATSTTPNGSSKRKQAQPQQIAAVTPPMLADAAMAHEEGVKREHDDTSPPCKQARLSSSASLSTPVTVLSPDVDERQSSCEPTKDAKPIVDTPSETGLPAPGSRLEQHVQALQTHYMRFLHEHKAPPPPAHATPSDLRQFETSLRSTLTKKVENTVESMFANLVKDIELRVKQSPQDRPQTSQPALHPLAQALQAHYRQPQPGQMPFPFPINPYLYQAAAAKYFGGPQHALGSIFPQAALQHMTPSKDAVADAVARATSTARHSASSDVMSSTFNSLMSRRKRNKVTDSRLSKLPVRGDSTAVRDSPLRPASQTERAAAVGALSMVAPNGRPDPAALFQQMQSRRPSSTGLKYELGGDYHGHHTLTPIHLRKAKLMFFFVRYPSSSMLKGYFPDVIFNKHNTAQLVKWFSNFREFYYIQMEKFARQMVADGEGRPPAGSITPHSELYKVLNGHYNRQNKVLVGSEIFHVPASFCHVVETTLDEFHQSISARKDADPSWKKQIYKVIARLDEPIPDHFRSATFVDQID